MPAFDIEAVRAKKAALLRGDYQLLLGQLAALRELRQYAKVRVIKLAIEKVRAIAKSEGVELGGAPIMGDGRKVLSDEGVRAIWELLLKGKSQQETARMLTTYPEDADVHRFARLEAQRMGGREDDGEPSRLGVSTWPAHPE
jgi:hypothetical protein